MQTQKNLTGYPSIDKPWLKYYSGKHEWKDPEMNIADYIRQRNIGREAFTAITYFGKKISYKKLFQMIDNASSALSSIGAKKRTGFYI